MLHNHLFSYRTWKLHNSQIVTYICRVLPPPGSGARSFLLLERLLRPALAVQVAHSVGVATAGKRRGVVRGVDIRGLGCRRQSAKQAGLKVDTFLGRPRLEAGLVHVKCPLCYTCLLPTDHIFSLLTAGLLLHNGVNCFFSFFITHS